MNKAFVKESENDDEVEENKLNIPPGVRNYMTTRGHLALKTELEHLVKSERPKLVEIVAWAASNGDRSENGDYIYGKRRLREIDRRIRFLHKRLDTAVVVAPEKQENTSQVFFGATVTLLDCQASLDETQTYQIVGIDEANASEGRISWISPLAKALLKSSEGDIVRFMSPAGPREIEILEISYTA